MQWYLRDQAKYLMAAVNDGCKKKKIDGCGNDGKQMKMSLAFYDGLGELLSTVLK